MTWRSVPALLLVAAVGAGPASARPTRRELVRIGDVTREFWLHVPDAPPPAGGYPVVLSFHGGGGNARQMERETRFSSLADRDTFVVVYPQGIGNQWNDGREVKNSRAHEEHVDEVAYVRAVLDSVSRRVRMDPRRVFATGISNGAFISNFLAERMSDRIAAIAPVAGGIGQEIAATFRPGRPVSVLVMQGTEDPVVPYAGGGVMRGRRGSTISSDSVVSLWKRADGLAGEPRREWLADTHPEDRCRVQVERWESSGLEDASGGAIVVRFRLVGGGHTWPNGTQYLPRLLVGRVCRDVDGTDVIWRFFKGLRPSGNTR